LEIKKQIKKMKTKYIISEDEKNRILGLHNDAKKILIEGYGEVSEGGMMCEDCGKVHEGSCGGMYEDEDMYEDMEEMDEADILLRPDWFPKPPKVPHGEGGMKVAGGDGPCPCGINSGHPVGSMSHDCCGDGRMSKGKKTEMGETALPQGWTMKTATELEDESMMDEIYEVWSGQEDKQSLLNEMRQQKETVYQLPARFGNKRLTESQLINMISNITK
tara:strand:- start:1654 stop:2307 length:654 start_codon:yes stop_codon:yes gene_type:complete